ncbi:hypothetical protein KC336_g5 [Hortaea werneckii]|nr:hypothetical protein KC336_g5 [Hortaea werneckii]
MSADLFDLGTDIYPGCGITHDNDFPTCIMFRLAIELGMSDTSGVRTAPLLDTRYFRDIWYIEVTRRDNHSIEDLLVLISPAIAAHLYEVPHILGISFNIFQDFLVLGEELAVFRPWEPIIQWRHESGFFLLRLLQYLAGIAVLPDRFIFAGVGIGLRDGQIVTREKACSARRYFAAANPLGPAPMMHTLSALKRLSAGKEPMLKQRNFVTPRHRRRGKILSRVMGCIRTSVGRP